MKLIGNVFAVGIVAAACTVVACSAEHGVTGSGNGGPGGGSVGQVPANTGTGTTGTIGANLVIGPGVVIQSVPWTISNTSNTYTGVANIGDAQSIEWVAGGIQQGTGYTVSVNTTDSVGDKCTGTSLPFAVTAGQVSQVTLTIICTTANDSGLAADIGTGSVEVDASITQVGSAPVQCPGITSFSINPAELQPGQPAQLGVASTGSPIITWSVTGVSPTTAGGSFSPSANVANPTFLCNTPNSQVSVTVTVSLPADAGGPQCAGQVFTTLSALVNCEGTGGGTVDAGPPDTGTGTVDAGPPDTGTGTVDSGPDTGTGTVDAGSPPALHARLSATDDVNSVNCQGNGTNGVCSPTEAVFVSLDISQHVATAAGDDPAAGCYSCLFNQGCIDDTVFPDTGHECADISGNFTAGDGNTDTATNDCLATVSCIVSSACGQTNGGVDNCYCGAGGGSPSQCPTNGALTNGACKTQETNGFTATANDATTILNDYTNLAQPSGLANQIFVCGVANGCTQCLQ